MKIGIQNTPIGFTKKWIEYCEKNSIDYKLIDSYKNDVIKQLEDCDAFMWHHDLLQKKDNLIAKRVLTAVEHSGKICFPSIFENWHYDDKIAQKYLLEAIKAPLVPTYVFCNKQEAEEWANTTTYPKVFKLKGGAGSINVKLMKNKATALEYIDVAFSKGFVPVSKNHFLKESIRKYKNRQINEKGLLKSIYRYLKPADKSFVNEKQIDYIYFQDFIPNNDYDIRLVVINESKVFGLKRYNRENDFRASGSGNFDFLKQNDIDNGLIKMVLDVSKKLKMSSIAFDIVFDTNNQPLIIEITYAYVSAAYNNCPGYWDDNLIWYEEKLDKYQGWMVEEVIRKVKNKGK